MEDAQQSKVFSSTPHQLPKEVVDLFLRRLELEKEMIQGEHDRIERRALQLAADLGIDLS